MKLLHVEKGLYLLALMAALMACKKGDESSEKPAEKSAASSGDKVGVPECDEYLDKYEKCLKDNVPAAARGPMEEAMKTTRDTWKQSASSAAGKSALAQACKQALDTAKTAMASYNCKW